MYVAPPCCRSANDACAGPSSVADHLTRTPGNQSLPSAIAAAAAASISISVSAVAPITAVATRAAVATTTAAATTTVARHLQSLVAEEPVRCVLEMMESEMSVWDAGDGACMMRIPLQDDEKECSSEGRCSGVGVFVWCREEFLSWRRARRFFPFSPSSPFLIFFGASRRR